MSWRKGGRKSCRQSREVKGFPREILPGDEPSKGRIVPTPKSARDTSSFGWLTVLGERRKSWDGCSKSYFFLSRTAED